MITRPRRFVLERDVDVSGLSGTGVVADGVVFPDGIVALHYLGRPCRHCCASSAHARTTAPRIASSSDGNHAAYVRKHSCGE
jgi:hypothetical protein